MSHPATNEIHQIAPALSTAPTRRLVIVSDPPLQLQANVLASLDHDHDHDHDHDQLLVVSTQAFGRAGNS